MNTKPKFSDWVLSGIGIAFVLMGFLILPFNRDVGITTIAFFGFCSFVFVGNLMRKFRYARLDAGVVQVAGNTRIQPSRIKTSIFGLVLLGLGTVLLVFSHDAPLVVQCCFWAIAGTGGLVLLAVISGVFPGRYLEFRFDGLIFAYKGWSVLLPWDRIDQVSGGEIHRNPVLFITLSSLDGIEADPPGKQEKFIKYVQQCRGWMGADLFLITAHYSVDLPVLVGAIDRYRTDREARAELVAKEVLTQSSK